MKIPEIFKKCEALTMRKRQDYTTNPNVNNHENFERSAEVASWFSDPADKPYAILIGTKLARLGSLLGQDKEAQNESIEDSFLDLINYCALWMERRSETIQKSEVEPNPTRSTVCYFCSGPVIDLAKVISGRYKQAHLKCFLNVPAIDRTPFLS